MGMVRGLSFSVLLATALLVSGCGTPGDHGPATQAEIQAAAASATAVPRFQGGEKIRITVYGEPTLSGDYDIDPSGVVSLPLAGTVRAVGLTQPEFETELAKKFNSEYLKNPKVTVTILQFRPFYIVGEITKAGEFPFKPGLNILTAMALAGGGTYRANRNYVLIQHVGETDMKEYPQSAETMVLPGDLIRDQRLRRGRYSELLQLWRGKYDLCQCGLYANISCATRSDIYA
jgi:protein involved in polysaccharide export with SLBB domain